MVLRRKSKVLQEEPKRDEFLDWLIEKSNKKVTMELKEVLKVYNLKAYKKYND